MNNNIGFRDILKNKLELRQQKNKKYSLRAYARDLGLSSSLLSEILSGKKGLSLKMAGQVAENLGMNPIEQSYFCDLVTSTNARKEGAKILAQDRLENYRKIQMQSLTMDSFALIHDWFHFAILELTHIEGFVADAEWVSKRLNVQKDKIESAVKRLSNMGLLEILEDGNWKDTQVDLATPDGFSFSYLRQFHKQLIEKSILALEEQSVDERDITSLLVSVDSEKLPEAKKRIRDFRNEFIKEFNGPHEKKDNVYCLGIQLFNLTSEKSV